MKKNRYTITKKWESKLAEMRKKADIKFSVLIANKKKKFERKYEYEWEKNERKKASYIKKKEEEYKRKMLNEIRECEWKPKKEYKTPAPKIKPLQFAMDIAQENAKLRDTDADWRGKCISHPSSKIFEWSGLAGGHRFSRQFQSVCLELENINAQCHDCNWTTWPRGNSVEKERINAIYDKNLDIKYWEWTADKLKQKVVDYFQWRGKKYDLYYEIPRLIEENEELWKTKNFYAPKKKWREIWVKYTNRVKPANPVEDSD